MRRSEIKFGKRLVQFPVLMSVGLLLVTAILATVGKAQQKDQKTFSTAEEASQAIYAAAKTNDEKAVLEIFGVGGKQILSSGDIVEDEDSRSTFVQAYEEMHRLVNEPDGTVTLYVGAKNWPTPVPLVHKGDRWYFDTEAGAREILFRRIGRNEVEAIHICRALAAAEKEFFQQRHEYAQKIFSEEGRQDGLYWQVANGEQESPIGPLIAQAVKEGYSKSAQGAPTPYRGYLFHILAAQGKNASGGAKSYITGGTMTGGFAFVAYPAEYRSSGVKTFVVSANGVVFEKDLGKDTKAAAESMTMFNPDSTWQRTEDE